MESPEGAAVAWQRVFDPLRSFTPNVMRVPAVCGTHMFFFGEVFLAMHRIVGRLSRKGCTGTVLAQVFQEHT